MKKRLYSIMLLREPKPWVWRGVWDFSQYTARLATWAYKGKGVEEVSGEYQKKAQENLLKTFREKGGALGEVVALTAIAHITPYFFGRNGEGKVVALLYEEDTTPYYGLAEETGRLPKERDWRRLARLFSQLKGVEEGRMAWEAIPAEVWASLPMDMWEALALRSYTKGLFTVGGNDWKKAASLFVMGYLAERGKDDLRQLLGSSTENIVERTWEVVKDKPVGERLPRFYFYHYNLLDAFKEVWVAAGHLTMALLKTIPVTIYYSTLLDTFEVLPKAWQDVVGRKYIPYQLTPDVTIPLPTTDMMFGIVWMVAVGDILTSIKREGVVKGYVGSVMRKVLPIYRHFQHTLKHVEKAGVTFLRGDDEWYERELAKVAKGALEEVGK